MEEDEDDDNLFRSDHEFSCESDVPDDEAQPIKHARTATKKKRKAKTKRAKSIDEPAAEEEIEDEEAEAEEEEAFACRKCDKSDHPEWILLCDKCDCGWHASCLRPALMVIPEGDWFCPDCQHAELLEKLEDKLKDFESLLKKKDADLKRKERLAFVSLSLSNIMPESNNRKRAKQRADFKNGRRKGGGSRSSESSCEKLDLSVQK